MAEFTSPGRAGFPTQNVFARGDSGLTAAKLARRGLAFNRSTLEAGHATVFRPAGVGSTVQIYGLNAILNHYGAVEDFLAEVMWPLLHISAQLVVHNARQMVPVDTWDTYNSIYYVPFTGEGMLGVDIGPTTFYAPWLEYGTSKMAPRPFMHPAARMIEGPLQNATTQIARVVSGDTKSLKGGKYGKLDNILSAYRSQLYDNSKRLGDLSAIFGIGILPGLRANMFQRAGDLGNIQAVMRGHIGTRITHIFSGRMKGRMQSAVTGGGTGMSINTQLGPQFARIYNVQVSKIGSRFLP